MYTIEENVRIVISLLKQNNIRHIVISPGGTNIPLTTAFQSDSFFHCYSVVDERSAIYFSIGLYWQLGEIIATCCTSAQATRNYIPGLTEAFYKHVPILAITTSKLERYLYQDYMQAPNQVSLPEDAVKKSFDIPYIYDIHDLRITCEQRVKDAILELTRHGKGPVQLNVRISDKENMKFENFSLPKLKNLRLYNIWDDWSDIQLFNKRILIVIGEHRPFSKKEIEAIESFSEVHNVFVYCNHLSNYHGNYSLHANILLSSLSRDIINEKSLMPDILITLGGQTGDYSLFGKLVDSAPDEFEHWRICDDGKSVDTYGKLTKIFECPLEVFFKMTSSSFVKCRHSYFDSWNELWSQINLNIHLPFSNAEAAQILCPLIPKNSYIHFAILNSLREWSLFPLHESVICSSNVAAFGIDGCMSMLIGESINTDELCFLIIGDLAFFYDMNSLGIRHIKNNIRILLVNNGGGAEFRFMTNGKGINIDSYISAKGHNSDAGGWALSNGFEYYKVNNSKELKELASIFVEKSDKPILMELITNFEDEFKAYHSLIDNNKKESYKESIKRDVKKIIGPKTLDIIKRIRK